MRRVAERVALGVAHLRPQEDVLARDEAHAPACPPPRHQRRRAHRARLPLAHVHRERRAIKLDVFFATQISSGWKFYTDLTGHRV